MPKKIAVAILNWNGAALLQQFLPSVLRHSGHIARIYVIDNASTDHSIALLKKEFPDVIPIINDQNYGYAGGYNHGIAHIEEEFIVLLNSDVEVTGQWLEPMLAHLERDPSLAAIQPKILDYKNRGRFEYAGACGGFVDNMGYPFCRGRIFYEIEEDRGQYDTFKYVFWATGASLMIRRKVFEEAGKLNELLFAHMEEIDLCWRIHNKGYRIACEPSSTVFHLGGATLSKQSPRKTFLNFRNNLIILFLNLLDGEAFIKIFLRLLLDGAAAIKFLADLEPRHALAILKAHFSFYAMFPRLVVRKRSVTQRSMNMLSGIYRSNIVEDFFLKRKRKFSDLPHRHFRT